jgi:hypothetical protein
MKTLMRLLGWIALMGLAAPALADSVQRLDAVGAGAVTSPGASGCQFSPGLCVVTSSGTLTGDALGQATFTSTLNILWSSATPNGGGGFCAPASGTTTVTAAAGDVLALGEVGTVCEAGHTGTPVPHTFNGTYVICSQALGGAAESPCSAAFASTGRFASASGAGNAAGGDDGNGNTQVNLSGTISGASN